ncbi:vomeronasal type-1 receptor 1-like [Dromiciops gliroides]|uniref:vomeronasal type-1 receptor 1-like n=1 Tax=Dromiciops gliroides TaxID=33562 RepID=UPI001CC67945|nr:vomeronasal type-1 receptor 1-like [Dromiciops gliroides]
MISHDEILKIIYLNQIVIGVLGNSFLISLYSVKFKSVHKTRSIILILIHVLFTNILLLLFRGIPKTIEVWGLKYSVDYTGSIFLTYLQRVTRSLSLCSSFLLSIFQAVIISPNSLIKTELKSRALKCIFPCCLSCWVLNLLIDTALPVYIIGFNNRTHSKEEQNIGFSALDLQATKTIMFLIWKFVYDGFFVGLMAITSGYIVLFLYKHHQRVQHIHITTLSQRGSPEIHAARAILLLGSIFVSFNLMSSICVMYMTVSKVPSPVLLHVSVFLSLSFQTVSPFMLLKSDTQIMRSCWTHWQMQNPSSTELKF